MLSVALVLLPFAAALFARWSRQRLRIRRRLSDTRVQPGQRVDVHLEIENQSPAQTPFLLIEDRFPPQLGRPARLVVASRPRGDASRCATRSRATARALRLGPLTLHLSDPFGSQVRVEFDERDELVV